MSIWQVLLDTVILLGGGVILGGLFERFRQSAIVGYLVAGALLGPNVLHVVRGTEQVLAVSELGVALLLFAIGLEFSWSRLRTMGGVALGGGTLQVVGTTLLGGGIAALAGTNLATALTIGAIVALSSTASVLRTLTERGEVESVHGERALGILLVQDMAVVPLVLLVTVLADGGSAREAFLAIARAGAIGAALVAGLFVVFHYIVPILLSSGPMHTNRELPLLVAVVSGLGSGVVAHGAGVSPALGAFVAGMVLAGSPFAVQVRADVSSLKTLLLTLFFTAVGMLCDPAWIARNAPAVGSVVVGVVLLKALIVWGALRVFGARGQSALAAGICLGQIGEFSFVLAGVARGTLLDESAFLLIVSSTVLTMFLTPFLVAAAPDLAARATRRKATVFPAAPDGEETSREVAVVIGFGPAGRASAERIAELGGRVVVVDQNPIAARDARKLGYRAVTGDARHGDVLEHAGLSRARSVVVTVPSAEAALQIVRYVRLAAPEARLLVRGRFHRSLVDLQGAGAHVVVDEEHEVGRLIAAAYEREADGSTGGAGA